jgi:hypothetical protein
MLGDEMYCMKLPLKGAVWNTGILHEFWRTGISQERIPRCPWNIGIGNSSSHDWFPLPSRFTGKETCSPI